MNIQYLIYFEGWNRNCFDEEGPCDYIFNRIKELKGKKESSCIIL